MALRARHRWVAAKVAESFGLSVEAAEDACKANKAALDALFGGTQTKLIILFQPVLALRPGDDEWTASSSAPVVQFTDGSGVPIQGKALFVVSEIPPGKQLDPDKTESGLLCGEINDDPLQSFRAQLEAVYSDAFRSRSDWGAADTAIVEELKEETDRLVGDVSDTLRGREVRFSLQRPDAKHNLDELMATATQTRGPVGRKVVSTFDHDVVREFTTLLGTWCTQIARVLELQDDISGEADASTGPRDVLDWWHRRTRTLTSITEQLKSKWCNAVLAVLAAVVRIPTIPEKLSGDAAAQLRVWKDINMRITEAANEAKDNVKYLFTLEKFIEPLYTGTPVTIVDALPALLNSVKMIHSIARYFNTPERMTDLLIKITNQMVLNAKRWVLDIQRDTTGEKIWQKDPAALVVRFRDALELNRTYQETYRVIREKHQASLAGVLGASGSLASAPMGGAGSVLSVASVAPGAPRVRPFEFNEAAIFSRFDLFCRRAAKLAHMFETISHFRAIASHKLEGMSDISARFERILTQMQARRYDLLAFTDNAFDRDFVEFNVKVNEIEGMVQQYIATSFESIASIEESLHVLAKFRGIFTRPILAAELDEKLHVIFQNYGNELERVLQLYEEQKHNPPKPRNLPPVAGNITWVRHLYKRIEVPMRIFEGNPAVLAPRDAKRIIKLYNRVARTLVAFEYLWYQAWVESIETAKAGLQATLVIRHSEDRKLYVNFDAEILQLIREAKCLDRMGVAIPESARMVLLQEEKFKAYFNDLSHMLREYARITDKVIPVTQNLIKPLLDDVDLRLRPGMVTLTWTSMNIESFKTHVHAGLTRLDSVVTNVNDIIENRIEKNLKIISMTLLVDLPADRSFSLDAFVDAQSAHTRAQSSMLEQKNLEVEAAVDDLIRMVSNLPLDAHIAPVAPEELRRIWLHYNHYMYSALLNSAKTSLNALKKRVAARMATATFYLHRPFFELDVQLAVPKVLIAPDLALVQAAINRVATLMLGCFKTLVDWSYDHLPTTSRPTFFDRVTKDIEIVRVVLLLTGSVQGTKEQVRDFLNSFLSFEWLWVQDPDALYEQFLRTNPDLDAYDRQLQRFLQVEESVDRIASTTNIGALALRTLTIKTQLKREVRKWMKRYIDNLHRLAREKLMALTDYCKTTSQQLGREVDTLNSLSYIMELLREIRDRQSGINTEIEPILDMYSMLERYSATISQEEQDTRSILWVNWAKLIGKAEEATDSIATLQVGFRAQLLRDIKTFKVDTTTFRADFEVNGPTVEGLTPQEAMERLKRYEDEFGMRDRKRELYQSGERLFAIPITDYPPLELTRKELALLQRLYGLYRDVMARMDEWNTILWVDVIASIDKMTQEMDQLNSRCTKLPGKLRSWQAFKDLEKQIVDFMKVLPLLTALSKNSIMKRHWEAIMEKTGHTMDVESPEFRLRDLLAAPLVQFADEITEITDGADKELALEIKLTDLDKYWDMRRYNFNPWKTRGVDILLGEKGVIDELDEAQLQLQAMLTSRNIKPFRARAQTRLKELSDTSEALALWAKVQQTWCSLESVFLAGDISKEMPLVAKKFQKLDKDFLNIMHKAKEDGFVVKATMNEVLRSQLPVMHEELQFCQNKLDSYLEQKRSKFPRFYFVSDPVLLQILSKGSDLQAIQEYYKNVFAAVTIVDYDAKDKSSVVRLKNQFGSSWEVVDLIRPVKALGSNIEDWLDVLLTEMQRTLKKICEDMAAEIATMEDISSLRAFVDGQMGQYALLGIQIMWTTDVQVALDRSRTSKTAMRDAMRRSDDILARLSSWCLDDLGSKMNRTKIETLITIQVHQRDIVEDLIRRRVRSVDDFEWLKQTRFHWEPDQNDSLGEGRMRIKITDVNFDYQFEYLGVKERLVITPLTDRCYITLGQALGMYLGGAPAGPAGTGKTETVKDMGNTLGIFVVVTNCSDQMRYTDCAKIFKGLCQSGLWGCFDEFNRITLPVLSVVAQQVQSINDAKRANLKTFDFLGEPVVLNPVCGYFITMNPGYAGRQELPENLKTLFRGVAMMVPDREMIIRVKLCSVGYKEFTHLAKKFFICYQICEQQLSKQKHYDFGLRNILSVLRTAGSVKRDNVGKPEEELLYQTLRDMNLSKFVAQDVPLFESMLADLFPAIEAPAKQSFPDVEAVLVDTVRDAGLIFHDTWVLKVVQLHATCLVRHGIMLSGPTGGGKSRIFNVLQRTMEKVAGTQYKMARLNPKAIAAKELYGHPDPRSGEWVKGVFAALWEKYNNNTLPYITWIVEDGPVDAIWIEDLNTVLDDNKLLTLSNGDRFPMTDNTKIMFENETLRNASPATVSRAGIIYVSDTDLDWKPVADAWLATLSRDRREILADFFPRFVGTCKPEDPGHLFRFLIRNTVQVIPLSRVGVITACFRLLHGLMDRSDESFAKSDPARYRQQLERLFIFCVAWSVGGLLEPEDRQRFDEYLRTLAPATMPPASGSADGERLTIFEFVVDPKSLEWQPWRPPRWEYPSNQEPLDFSNLLVPTMDSTRSLYLLEMLHLLHMPVLMVGGPGTAKTSTALMFFGSFDPTKTMIKQINFSSATTPRMLQDTIESSLEKRGGKTYCPPSGKTMAVFIDDLSMPEVNLWGDQPTNEMTRQIIEEGGLYFLDKDRRGDFKVFEGLTYVAAMIHPGGGRNDIPNRLKRHFFVFNLVLPAIKSIDDLYGQMLRGRFEVAGEFDAAGVAAVRKLTRATISLWNAVKAKMLPTPAKFHYIFNMRELSRVFQGILLTPKGTTQTGGQQTPRANQSANVVSLWKHECTRVFEDKLTNIPDKDWFRATLERTTREVFGDALAAEVATEAFFVDFFRDDVYDEDEVLQEIAPKIYEPGGTLQAVRERVQKFMEAYNKDKPSTPLNLVLFDDALRHLLRISRIIQMPRGSALLVGVGGSGKQSLTRLAAYMARSDLFQITLTKTYNVASLKENLKYIFDVAGHQRRSITFLFTDAEIKDEDFLEYINSILMTGEVSGLFAKDEMMAITGDLQPFFVKERPGMPETQDNLWNFFIQCARDRLHLVLCMSPVNPKFPERARKFPGLISSTSIDWFLPWPVEALVTVARGLLIDYPMETEAETKLSLIEHVGKVHSTVVEVCAEYYAAMRRNVYQTPKSFLSFIKNFKTLYQQKLDEVHVKEERVNRGLEKLLKGAKDVEDLKKVLATKKVELQAATQATNELLAALQIDQAEAHKKSLAVAEIRTACEADKNRIEAEFEACAADLARAQPIVDGANMAIDSITPPDITFIRQMKSPSDILRLVMDGVLILLFRPVEVTTKATVLVSKQDWEFLQSSWSSAMGLLTDGGFLGYLQEFKYTKKDQVTEETIELLSAYLDLPFFKPDVAGAAAKAAKGLATWVRAMSDYFYASRIVKPKLAALEIANAQLSAALERLAGAETEERAVQARLAELRGNFERQMAFKQQLEDNALALQAKLEQAEALINGLSGERVRWTADSKSFAERKRRLVGDSAVACAFLSYCGPFNSQFRDYMIQQKFIVDLKSRNVPVTAGLDVISFLVSAGDIGDWNIAGLPTDPLSIQNGILVTRSERFPLLVDPQGQAFKWITSMERRAGRIPTPEVTALNSTKLKDNLEFCMSEGRSFIVVGVEEELDPLLDPILEKQIIQKTRTRRVVKIADQEVDLDNNFKMFFLTRLPNPHFSPELQAKTTVVDFTVTMQGLEDQLLGIVIQREQRALEEQLEQVLRQVNENRKQLLKLDEQLLAKLSGNSGNLLEEEGLVEMLAHTKATAADVSEKLERAEETKISIAEQREQYRPVATRGSVLYFSIVDMSLTSVMYQTSLDQFVVLFLRSMTEAPKHTLTIRRVENIIDVLTYIVYRYVNKGLYERHKLLFVFLVTLKILVRSGLLEQSEVGLFLRGGAALDYGNVRQKPKWISDEATWLNVIALADAVPTFRSLPDNIFRSEPHWCDWFNHNEPENAPVPDFEVPLRENRDTGPWLKLLLLRMLRMDRTLLCVRHFIRDTAIMGPRYVEPVTDTIEEIFDSMDQFTPVIFLLSIGADPTEAIQTLAKRRKNTVSCISMGEGQEPRAKADIRAASVLGSWVLLQNCELGLGLMDEMEDILKDMRSMVHPDFRLFITALPHPKFPLGLLQMSTKVTNEPPAGLRAGLVRSFTVMVDQDRLERIDIPAQADAWRRLLFSLCFMHSIVQERRKFGPLGFNIPYEFNNGDLSACIMFLERHLYTGTISWPTVQYMVSEVQYGGKITDDMDRRLFNCYASSWVSPGAIDPAFSFNPAHPVAPIPGDFVYRILQAPDIESYRSYASSFPDVDSPEIFGLHPNADVTFRNKEVRALLDTVAETQPRSSGGGSGGRSLDDVVMDKAKELLDTMPADYPEDETMEKLARLGGIEKPMNIFLYQEIQRLQSVISFVRNMLKQIRLAIKGDVVLTRELQEAMTDIFDARVPKPWLFTPGGDEFSWLFPSLGSWNTSLGDRERQCRAWLNGEVPYTFWITCFFNPQGFLTAMKQEVSRRRKWSLDSVLYFNEITEWEKPENCRERPDEGVYLHGLSLDGARWAPGKVNSLVESEPKKLYSSVPVMKVTVLTQPLLKAKMDVFGPNGPYECPVYRYAKRTDRYLIFMAKFPSRGHIPEHWILRGVAALCSTHM